jgi:hypothetical protein
MGESGGGPRRGHDAAVPGLAQGLQGIAAELGQLIERMDAVVGEADLAPTSGQSYLVQFTGFIPSQPSLDRLRRKVRNKSSEKLEGNQRENSV